MPVPAALDEWTWYWLFPSKSIYRRRGKTLKHPQLLRVLAGLFVQGRTRYEEVELFRSDALFHRSLELPYALAA